MRFVHLSGRWSTPFALLLWVRAIGAALNLALSLAVVAGAGYLVWSALL